MRMILDTSFVMTESFEQSLLESLQPLVQHIIPEQKKLVLPYSVVENELKKIALRNHKDIDGRSKNARRALKVIKKHIDLFDIFGATNDASYVDHLLSSVLLRYSTQHHLILLTQDKKLVFDALTINISAPLKQKIYMS